MHTTLTQQEAATPGTQGAHRLPNKEGQY
jgi:hypothetical protein